MLFYRSIHFLLLLLLLCAPASGIAASMQNSVDLEVKKDTGRRIDCLNSYQNNSEIATFKPISQIKLGDKVLAKSEWKADADSLSYEAVTDIMLTPNQERTLVHINLSNGQKITTTDGHPFKTTEGWRDAILLKKGGKFLLKGGNEGNKEAEQALEITDISQSTEKVTTYNLEVANAHTFFVGEQGVLVHNGRDQETPPPRGGPPGGSKTGQHHRGRAIWDLPGRKYCYWDGYEEEWEVFDKGGKHEGTLNPDGTPRNEPKPGRRGPKR